MIVRLYSTDCSKCNVLKKKLQDRNISFELVLGADKIKSLGFKEAPVLEIENNGEVNHYLFSDAVKFINNM